MAFTNAVDHASQNRYINAVVKCPELTTITTPYWPPRRRSTKCRVLSFWML